jgi:hypothetical protein
MRLKSSSSYTLLPNSKSRNIFWLKKFILLANGYGIENKFVVLQKDGLKG